MIPNNVMLFIAAVFPLASFVIGLAATYYLNNGWISTLVVFCGTFLAMMFYFTLHFWSWLLLYVFLGWLGNWGGAALRRKRNFRRDMTATS